MAPISFYELPPSQNHSGKTAANGESIPSQHKPPAADSSIITTNMPVVALDVDILTDTIAARLATSLLGHVLFLKNQIPLPIIQLSRLPNKQGNNKTAKLKADLLSAFDTIASHFVTSFSSLSTALAQIKPPGENTTPSRVYLAILVGPSLGAARSKVFYGVDKFQARVWGSLDGSGEQEEEESGDEYPEDSEDESTGEEDDSEVNSEGSEGNSDGEQGLEDSEGEKNDRASNNNDDSDDDDDDDDDDEKDGNQGNTAQNSRYHSPKPHQSYAEEQRFLQTADRLLARTLAAADANGRGIANEMSPTQTHILIRAPRRFNHPAWIPRQNLTKQMENALIDFLDETWSLNSSTGPAKKKQSVEGVWITGREGLCDIEISQEHLLAREEDEMIWWSWDGKLVGFADW